jgi:hypothetical protein
MTDTIGRQLTLALNLGRDTARDSERDTNRDTPLTEEEARAWVIAVGKKIPPVRELATKWGWHRSRVQRFVSRVKSKTVIGTTSETVAKLIAAVQPSPKEEEFDWRDESVVLVESQPSTAVYCGNAGHICIRQDARGDDEDPVILILPEFLPRLIARLSKLQKGDD